jgi:virginiamycin B lyase
MANVLGRIDPKTGQIKEYALKTPHSGPHGLIEDRDGNIWYTGNTGSLMGKLDPRTGAVTEYKTPEPGDPHTLIFDKSGILWFTMQNTNRPVLSGEGRGALTPESSVLSHQVAVARRKAAP